MNREAVTRCKLLHDTSSIGRFLAYSPQFDLGFCPLVLIRRVFDMAKEQQYEVVQIDVPKEGLSSDDIAQALGLELAGYGTSWDSIEDVLSTPDFRTSERVLFAFVGVLNISEQATEFWSRLASVLEADRGWSSDWPQVTRVVLA